MSNNNKKIVFASYVSIIGNVFLSAIKIIAGVISGSIAVLSDGIDSATDVIISVVMLITAKIMNRPPNEHFVYGYNKAEGIATKMLSFIIFYAGIQMFLSAIECIFSPQTQHMPESIAIYVTIFSIFGKLFLSIYQTRIGKQLNSSMLIANGINMRNDIIISVSVLIGLIFTFIFKMPILDPIIALFMSLIVIKSSIGIFKDSSMQLMDGVKDVNVYEKIFAAVALIPDAHNPHKVRSRTIGNLYAIVLDIEVADNLTIKEAHSIANAVEDKIKEFIPEIFDIVIHVEPLGCNHKTEVYGVTYTEKK